MAYAEHIQPSKILSFAIRGSAWAQAPLLRHELSEDVGFLIWLAVCANFKFADLGTCLQLRKPDFPTITGDIY